MCEEYKCIMNFIHSDDITYSVKYYLVTEDSIGYGIKTVMYKNSNLYSTNIFNLSLTKERAAELVDLLCINHVLPQTLGDILSDMGVAHEIYKKYVRL